MCKSIFLGNGKKEWKKGEWTDVEGEILIESRKSRGVGIPFTGDALLEGLVKQESVREWKEKGIWVSAEILADEFTLLGSMGLLKYEVLPGHSIKALVMKENEKLIVKVISREPVGKESLCFDRFIRVDGRRYNKASALNYRR